MSVSNPSEDPDFFKVESGDPDDGFAWKHKADVTEEDVPFGEEKVTYTYAPNGGFRVYVAGEQEAKGRGKPDLEEALEEVGSSMDEAQDVTE